ncbi:hypothetical protein [Nostoc sp. ChiSLP03a]|uniref:hypothetical protein n=1 Tax=Nostoc sp. ChiSLP03a TaxID=3075380 RepID=UPI002AD36EBF|nr:hypothetical protein [Nostoc sp. ChiSLP03a]MDZ8213684.1 hypothetical protein [Nostoc sp. ChiSLP03a]
MSSSFPPIPAKWYFGKSGISKSLHGLLIYQQAVVRALIALSMRLELSVNLSHWEKVLFLAANPPNPYGF